MARHEQMDGAGAAAAAAVGSGCAAHLLMLPRGFPGRLLALLTDGWAWWRSLATMRAGGAGWGPGLQQGQGRQGWCAGLERRQERPVGQLTGASETRRRERACCGLGCLDCLDWMGMTAGDWRIQKKAAAAPTELGCCRRSFPQASPMPCPPELDSMPVYAVLIGTLEICRPLLRCRAIDRSRDVRRPVPALAPRACQAPPPREPAWHVLSWCILSSSDMTQRQVRGATLARWPYEWRRRHCGAGGDELARACKNTASSARAAHTVSWQRQIRHSRAGTQRCLARAELGGQVKPLAPKHLVTPPIGEGMVPDAIKQRG